MTANPNAPETEILIVGAGPTGLMMAVWLAEAGVRSRVIEQNAGPTRETRAIAVQSRTLEFYDMLGLGTQVLAQGRQVQRVSMWARGRLAGQADVFVTGQDLSPYPYMFIFTQDRNEATLLARLRELGGSVSWNTRLEALSHDTDGVEARLIGPDGPETVRARYLVGCDGARSAVRTALKLDFPGGTYADTFYVADVVAKGQLIEGNLNLLMDNYRFQAYFPMPGRDHYRIVGVLPENAGEHPGFESVRAEVESHGRIRVESVSWFAHYRVHHRVAKHFRQGRCFLLGDAAHVHSPAGGQGMNTGLGDAVNLAWKLAQVLRGGKPSLLDSYEPERLPFAQALVQTTDRVFTVAAKPGALAAFIRIRIVPRLFGALTRLEAVRRWVLLTISQLKIHYPHSPLSAGEAGRVRGGDRLPWVPDGLHSNFDALRARDWQLHVYGSPGPELLSWCARRELPLKVFAFSPAARHAGLAEGAPYLIRPDGYVGLCAPRFEAETFDAYAARWLPKPSSAGVHPPAPATTLS